MFFANKNFIFSINPIQLDDYFSFFVKNNRTNNNENNENDEPEILIDDELFEMIKNLKKINKNDTQPQNTISNVISENSFEDKSRNFFKEYISLLDFNKEYLNSVKKKDLFEFILAKEQADFKLALYSHFYIQGFNVVSGKNYGFDYILYKKDDKEHSHGQYLVEVLDKKQKFFQVVAKIRVSNNYGKVKIFSFIYLFVSKKTVLLQAEKEENVIEPLNLYNSAENYKFKSLILKKSDI